MYDNIDLGLLQNDVLTTDFLSETINYFDVTGEHNFNGEYVISGRLNDSFKISVSKGKISIKDASLCKWYLGNNFETLQRKDVQHAIEKLSDILHLPIDKAKVTRFDVAQNFIMKYPVQVYYNHLGEMAYCKRVPVINGSNGMEGLYYYKNNKSGLAVFYNKIKEQKSKRQPIPELFQNRNVLRYEQRYTRLLPKIFNVECVTTTMLYNERFYKNIVDMWGTNYKSIQKINDLILNFEEVKGKKELYMLGVKLLVEQQGGEIATIEQINEMNKMGKINKKTAFDLRKAIKEACNIKSSITVPNDIILELDKKVNEAMKYYR